MKSIHFQFGNYPFRLKKQDGKKWIFDVVRKKFVTLTPEEWVRQNMIHYLIENENISRALLSIEKKLSLHGMTKRTDIVVYNKESMPQMIIECKAPDVIITQSVFDQASRYNLKLRVKYLLVTNGNESYCCEVNWQEMSFRFLNNLPDIK